MGANNKKDPNITVEVLNITYTYTTTPLILITRMLRYRYVTISLTYD